MPRHTIFCLALLLLMAMTSTGAAMMADIPLPIIAANSDLIVVARLDAAAAPVKMALATPDRPQPGEGWYRKYTLTITRTLRADAQAQAQPQHIDVYTPVAQPAPPGEMVLHVSDAFFFANLGVGQSYVMLLHRIPDSQNYYLPSYPKNCRPAQDDAVAQVERVAEVDKWTWGESVQGLAIAVMIERDAVQVVQAKQQQREPGPLEGLIDKNPDGGGGGGATSAFVSCVVALRNTSDQPITLTLYAEDRYLDVTATNKAGQTVRADFYSVLARMDMRAFGPWATTTIAPGEVLFIGPMGKAPHGVGVHLPLTHGQWQLTAGYKSKRNVLPRAMFEEEGEPAQDVPPADIPMWTGSITSKPVTLTGQ